jgi:hypothetical protein
MACLLWGGRDFLYSAWATIRGESEPDASALEFGAQGDEGVIPQHAFLGFEANDRRPVPMSDYRQFPDIHTQPCAGRPTLSAVDHFGEHMDRPVKFQGPLEKEPIGSLYKHPASGVVPMTFANPFDDFPEDDLDRALVKPTPRGPDAKTVRFPCSGCDGSGMWRGRGKCFACNGAGYFMTSERDRAKARQARHASKARRLDEARAAFDEQNPGFTEILTAQAAWSTFAADLLAKLAQYGSLSERQVAAIRNTAAKGEQRRQQRAAERSNGNATIDLAPIRAMFETARGNGYRRPVYRAAGLQITRAPDHGRNPGALYVVGEDDEYLGKIVGTSYTGKPAPALAAIAADPRGEAIKHGQRTGTCSCCGRLLTNEGSINLGIGPICASKFGL